MLVFLNRTVFTRLPVLENGKPATQRITVNGRDMTVPVTNQVSFEAGQVAEVPDDIGVEMIEKGHASEYDSVVHGDAPAEAAAPKAAAKKSRKAKSADDEV